MISTDIKGIYVKNNNVVTRIKEGWVKEGQFFKRSWSDHQLEFMSVRDIRVPNQNGQYSPNQTVYPSCPAPYNVDSNTLIIAQTITHDVLPTIYDIATDTATVATNSRVPAPNVTHIWSTDHDSTAIFQYDTEPAGYTGLGFVKRYNGNYVQTDILVTAGMSAPGSDIIYVNTINYIQSVNLSTGTVQTLFNHIVSGTWDYADYYYGWGPLKRLTVSPEGTKTNDVTLSSQQVLDVKLNDDTLIAYDKTTGTDKAYRFDKNGTIIKTYTGAGKKVMNSVNCFGVAAGRSLLIANNTGDIFQQPNMPEYLASLPKAGTATNDTVSTQGCCVTWEDRDDPDSQKYLWIVTTEDVTKDTGKLWRFRII